ncbi:MAG: peptide chain release factor N(5)-glutamine methyltransferase [Candidatus Margulisiibacteriota bacterium]|jgi:release factor glutamine methyltransferase
MTIAEALAFGLARLSNLEDPRLETEILLAHALQQPATTLISRSEQVIAPASLASFKYFIERRLTHEPTAYIVGYQPFLGLDFKVDKRVLIPRPETELLVEIAIRGLDGKNVEHREQNVERRIVDVGTGSGCIAITLAKNIPGTKITAIERSPSALRLAKENATNLGMIEQVTFLEGDLLSPLKEKVDLIVSNPPYIPTADLAGLDPDVKDWEPIGALDGGNDGLDYIRRLIKEAPDHLNSGGMLLFEFGFGQSEAIKVIFTADNRYSQFELFNDYAGIPRIAKAGIYQPTR